VELRKARPEDLDDVMDVESQSFEAERYERELIEAFITEKDFTTLVSLADRRIVGYATLYDKGGGSFRLISIAVLPTHRNQGIARALMRQLETISSVKRGRRMSLEVSVTNVPAISLYLSLGFRIKGTILDYYGKGKSAFFLEKIGLQR